MGNIMTAVRKYWDAQPCNIRHSNAPTGTIQYFDEVEARKYLVEPHIPAFADFGKYRGKYVLELGCGIGTDTINFARAGAIVTAVDISKTSINIAKTRANVFGLGHKIEFICGNIETINLKKKFDLVYAFGSIHHTADIQRAIMMAYTHLKTNGEFKAMVYHRYSWKRLWSWLKYGKLESEAQMGCPIANVYSKRQVKKLLGKLFDIKSIEIDHIFPYSIPEYKRYEYKMVWYFRFIPRFVFRWLEHHFGWHMLIKAKRIDMHPLMGDYI